MRNDIAFSRERVIIYTLYQRLNNLAQCIMYILDIQHSPMERLNNCFCCKKVLPTIAYLVHHAFSNVKPHLANVDRNFRSNVSCEKTTAYPFKVMFPLPTLVASLK